MKVGFKMEKEASVYGNSDIASVLFLISERLFKRFKKNVFFTLDIVLDRSFIVIKKTTCNTRLCLKNCMIHSLHFIAQLLIKYVQLLRV